MIGSLSALWWWGSSKKADKAEWQIPIVCQASSTLNTWTKNISKFMGGEMALFCMSSWAHQHAHSFQHPCCRHKSCPCYYLTEWGREHLSAQHTSLSSQRIKCSNGRPLSMWLTKISMTRSFTVDTTVGHQWGTSSNILRSAGAKEPPFNMVPLE